MFKKQIFGLDISDHSIEVLLLSKFFSKIEIRAYGRKVLKGEIVKNGIIKKPQILAKNIAEALNSAQLRPIKTKYCIISLPESQVFTHIFHLPTNLTTKQLKNVLPLKAEEIIPFSGKEVYFDFKIIGTFKNSKEIFYATVPSKIIKSYLELFESIGLKPIAFDLESLSLSRSLIDRNKKAEGLLMMDIGARTTNLNIFDKNGIRLNRIINVAGNRFTKSLVKGLNKSEEEAEKLKKEIGFDFSKEKSDVAMILQKEFQIIITETKKLINYFQDNSGHKIEKIILVGGSALLPKIDLYLSENLEIPVEIGNPFKNIYCPLKIADIKNKAVLFANVIGLALRGVEKNPEKSDINLLLFEHKKLKIVPLKKEKKAWLLVYIKLAIFIFLIFVLVGLIIFKKQGFDPLKSFFLKSSESVKVNLPVNLEELELAPESFLAPEGLQLTTTFPLISETTTPPTISSPPSIPSTPQVIIKETGLGFLNVREGPGLNYSIIGKADVGHSYELLAEDLEKGWSKIQFNEEQVGWVFSKYLIKEEIEE